MVKTAEKSRSAFRKGKLTVLKYARVFFVLNKIYPQEKLSYQSLTYLGERI